MRNVKVNKQTLTDTIKSNRASHRDLYEKAFEGYKSECIRILTENLDALNKGQSRMVVFNELPPEDHTDEYDTVLNMLAYSVDDVIELTNQEFKQYVEDDWNWRQMWAAANTKYISHR